MIRVNVVAEGQSGMYFVPKMLSVYPFSIIKNIEMYSRAVLTSKDQKTPVHPGKQAFYHL